MREVNLATPLIALEAVVLDTETTGLDARTARIVQFAAVGVRGAAIEPEKSLIRLINPQMPIPPATTAVHGLSDADVSGAPAFAAIAGEIAGFIGSSAIVGHNIGYDLAILHRQFAAAGHDFVQPPALDIRVLARIGIPSLAQYTLDALCEWFGVHNEKRHDAMGDALATAAVYVGLQPLLRERNIRTLAEAVAASSRSSDEDQRQLVAGWKPLEGDVRPASPTLKRIDSFPYRHRVSDLMSAPAVVIEGRTPVREALGLVIERRISSILVKDGNGEIGIATERDILRALHKEGSADAPATIGQVSSRPLQTVAADDFVYRAIGRMDRLGIRHLGVVDHEGQVVGVVTPRNLLRQRATTAIALGDEIDSASDVATLGIARGRLAFVAQSLAEEQVDARTICSVISSELGALTAKAASMAEARMAEAGRGGPPVRYAVLILGSGGRGESLLAADQDNAIVFEHGEPGGPEDVWFGEMATHMAAILDEVGVPLCKGGVMAKTPEWRHSVEGWKRVIDTWVGRSRPKDLLNVDIFYDAAPVHGDAALAGEIRDYAFAAGHRSRSFQMLLTELARDWRAPFTLFGGIKVDEKGRVDLKKGGLMPIFTGARVLAIRHDVRATATPARLAGVRALGIGSAEDLDAADEAHRVILGAILDQQLRDTAAGLPLSNRVEVARLGKEMQAELKTALGAISGLTGLLSEGRM
ncbi:MAG: DUF294 nucleotidyltransferase-like domain-containing protein [Hyphomicrobiaceae bacterium]